MKIWILETIEKKSKSLAVRAFAENVPAARAFSKAVGHPADLDVTLMGENETHEVSLYQISVEG